MSSACSRTYPVSFVPRDRRWMRSSCLHTWPSRLLAFWRSAQASFAQSTFGTVLGTVKDPSGSVVPMATVSLMNTGTNAEHSAITNYERRV